jgi:HEAT repeat protein
MDSKQIEMLSHVMLLLNPDAIQSVAPLCADPYPPEIQKRMSNVIKKLAQKDLGPLEKSLSRTDELVVQRLVYILGHLEGEKPQQILIKVTHHPSERVRREALKMLLKKKTVNVEKIFHLIEDLSDIIRIPAIKAIGRKRNQQAEDLLQNYLEMERFKITDPRHLLTCYQALGQCGSSRSIPFLKRMLLDRALSGLIVKKKSIHQQGAAIALIALDTKEAKDILKNASKSFYPNVRKACRKAVEVYK